MAQSVELLLDGPAEVAIRGQWALLADAGLPSEQRPGADADHRPHITLFASDLVPTTADTELSQQMAGLDIDLQIGAPMIFGPRRGRVILVRQVTASIELLRLQAAAAAVCRADPQGQFGPGRWSPHVTLARRIPVQRVGEAIAALDRTADRPLAVRVTQCRRWDGTAKTAWLL